MRRAQTRQIGPDQLAEELYLHIAHDAVADAIDHIGLDDLSQATTQRQRDDDQGNPRQRLGLGVGDEIVHRRLQDIEQQAGEHREQNRAQDRHRQTRPSWSEIRPGDAQGDVSACDGGRWGLDGHGGPKAARG